MIEVLLNNLFTLIDVLLLCLQVGLGETLCYKFEGERAELGGTVELTYLSLRSVYSVMDSYKFWLAASRVS